MKTKVINTLIKNQGSKLPKSFAVLSGVDGNGADVFIYAKDKYQLRKLDIRSHNLKEINHIKTVKEGDEDKIKLLSCSIKALFETGIENFVDESTLDDEDELDSILKVYNIILNLVNDSISEVIDQMDYISWIEKYMEDNKNIAD